MKMTKTPALFAAAFAAASLFSSAASAEVVSYKVDPAHTFVQFEIGHLGVSRTFGRFNKLEGSYQVDTENPANYRVELTIDAASVDTNHGKRDDHLRSPDFLDVKQFPQITFRSTAYSGSAEAGKLTGEMTLHGVTRTVSFDVKKVGEGKDPWGGYRSGYLATTTLKRSDFGVSYFIPGVSDEMNLTVSVEGIRN